MKETDKGSRVGWPEVFGTAAVLLIWTAVAYGAIRYAASLVPPDDAAQEVR